jgi:hypothetical protein
VQEVLGRALDRGHDSWVTVTGGAHGNAGGEVDIAIAVDVPHFNAATMTHHERGIAYIGR